MEMKYGDEERENENKLSMSTSDSNIDSVSYRILVDMFNDEHRQCTLQNSS